MTPTFFNPEGAEMARKTKVEAERTKLRILKAALDLFVEKGYERTTFEDVAERIGLSKGAVYWHFKSKPDLLTQLVVRMTKLHTEELGRVLSEPGSLDELRAHFVQRADFVVRKPVNRKFFRMMTRLDWSASKFAPVKCRIRQLENNIFTVIERTLDTLQHRGEVRKGVDVTVVTAVLGAMWLGLIKARTDQCLETGLAQTVAAGFDMVITAIRTHG